MDIIRQFISICEKKGDKIAFISEKKSVTFRELLSDIYKAVNFMRSENIGQGQKLLLLVRPSYEFFVLMLACIFYGVNLVVSDSYKKMSLLKKIVEKGDVSGVFCDSATRFLKVAFPRGTRFIDITCAKDYPDSVPVMNDDPERIILTTFTSGTTGEPKPIQRSVENLRAQIDIISANVEIDAEEVVFSKLPIYVLFMIYNGLTCVFSMKPKPGFLEKNRVSAISAPIIDLLKLEKELPYVRKVFIGGAMLYPAEAKKLKGLFPKADITYVYGSSECVLMAKGEINHYIENSMGLNMPIKGVDLSFTDTDEMGVGKITVSSRCVLTEDKRYVSNDLGYVDADGLHIVGRSNYSRPGKYNYTVDSEILSENPYVKRGFSFFYSNRQYFCYEGKLSAQNVDIVYIRFGKLPMDAKHKTKLDYKKVIELIEKKKY